MSCARVWTLDPHALAVRGLVSRHAIGSARLPPAKAFPPMLAPLEDDPERTWGPRPGRRRYWRDLGLRAAVLACAMLAALLGLVGLAVAILT
jgi:hypothetical protein